MRVMYVFNSLRVFWGKFALVLVFELMRIILGQERLFVYFYGFFLDCLLGFFESSLFFFLLLELFRVEKFQRVIVLFFFLNLVDRVWGVIQDVIFFWVGGCFVQYNFDGCFVCFQLQGFMEMLSRVLGGKWVKE